MRADREMPGNPWPHDMVIGIDEGSALLLTLLFVRHAWGLAPDADVPELDPAPDCGGSAMPSSATHEEWDRRWRLAWRRAWAWFEIEDVAGRPHPPELLRGLGPDSPLNPYFPPMWEIEHGDEGIDRAALNAWKASLRAARSRSIADQPERRNLDALIPAWRAGLDSIIVLPYRGYFARRLDRRHLVVSAATRDSAQLYDLALGSVT